MTPEEIRELYLSGELQLDDDVNDPDYELDEDDMHLDIFDEEDDFHDAEFTSEDEDDNDEYHGIAWDSSGRRGDTRLTRQKTDAEEGNDDGDNDDGNQAGASHEDERAEVQHRLISLITTRRPGLLSQRQVLEYLRRSNLGHLIFAEEDDEELAWGPRRRRPPVDPNRFPKVPSEKGIELMNSGIFGASEIRTTIRSKKRLARRILDRELGLGNITDHRVNQGMMAQSLIPTTDAEMIIHYDEPVYSGQFSDDGNFFYACVKDFKVRMYDTSNPYNWRHYKTVAYPGGTWTLTDATLSPDNRWLAYTSITSQVCLAPTDPNDTGDPYTLNLGAGRLTDGGWSSRLGIFSIRFSGDGRELVAGTTQNSIVVYDIESRRVLHSVTGHKDDVNAVCFADKSSPHILYSGSDDTTIKVWDRRSMGDGREAGAFVGHIEGLTYLDSKGDGRYILSNGKDQSMKLWDLKKMYTTARLEELNPRQYVSASDFDYRWSHYDDRDWFPHPDDNSVVTFRGHSVLSTLIRCHFSPPGSTDSRYVYTGSADGKVWVYNMDATVARVIDVQKTSQNARALPAGYHQFYRRREFQGWSTCVRDASWHPNAPFIAASSLNGWDHALGTVTVHSYNESSADEGEPRMGAGYDEKLKAVNPHHTGNDDSSDEDQDDDEEGGEDEGAWRNWAI
ncbi:hypothetical protein DL769_005967 [Monosporascus sp. CRB-8-3]|nr:hypothetical protein DL769_005967 [Monosporascus sp. CRB-8-3]